MADVSKPKYDSLPGIDTAPDVYETPDLDNDTSTIQASTAVSDSEGDDTSDEESTIQRQRLQTDQARSRFRPSRVDAQGVDFSDNIAAQRRSYRTSTWAQRRRGEILGDDSDDEKEKETFTKKLLRMKEGVLELYEEYNAIANSEDRSKIEGTDARQMMEYINDQVDQIYDARRGGGGPEAQLERTVKKFQNYEPFGPSPRLQGVIARKPPLPGSQIERSQLEFVLNQAADFDARLGELEKSLGLNGNRMPDIADKSVFPVFTTLEILEQKVGAVSDASFGNLESAAQQVKKMIADAEHLKELREEASEAGANAESQSGFTEEQEAKINALYGTLPSINKLSPMLPLVLDHLRTLRLVHTSAFEADKVLTELEKRQAKQEEEIKNWGLRLDRVEADIKECEDSTVKNISTVSGWIKDFEKRIAQLDSHPPGE